VNNSTKTISPEESGGTLKSIFLPAGNPGYSLYFIIALGFLLRIYYVIETAGTPFYQFLFSDSKIYADWAASIASSNEWIGKGAYFMAPAYPYFLAVFYKIFDDPILPVRIIQVFISTLNIYLIYLAANKIFDSRKAIIAALLTAFYGPFIFYSGAILSETLQVFVITLGLLFLANAIKSNNWQNWLYAGLAFGVSAIFRATILLPIAIIIIYCLITLTSKKVKTEYTKSVLTVFIAGVLFPIALIFGRNLFVTGEPILLTSNGGINFYIGNNERSPGVFVTPTEFDFYSDLAGKQFASQQSGKQLSSSEASSYWYGKAFAYLKDNPGKALTLYSKKAFLFIFGNENPQSTVMNPEYFKQNYSNLLKLPLIQFALISILSIIGFWSFYRNGNFVYLLFTLGYFISTIIFFVNGRFRLGLTPLLIIFASAAVLHLFELFSKAKTADALKLISIPAAFYVFYILIIPKPAFNDYDAYFHLGEIAYQNKEYDKSIDYYNRSLFFKDHYMSYMNTGNAFAMKRDFRNAVGSYQKAIARNPKYLLAHFNLAFAYNQSNNYNLAIETYNKVIELNPAFEDAYRNLGITYYVLEKYEEAILYFEKFIQISAREDIKAMVRQDIETSKRKIAERNNE